MITLEQLLSGRWTYGLKNGYIATRVLKFGPDGRIYDYHHRNEHSWILSGDGLVFRNENGDLTAGFTNFEKLGTELKLEGISLVDPGQLLVLCRDEFAAWPQRPESTKTQLADRIKRFGWSIGDHTYGRPEVIEPDLAGLTIGKYTSIANGVHISLGDHDTANVSSFPFYGLRDYWPGVRSASSDHATKGPVKIGNDVWIGQNVFITSGVTIGDGAVIGAHSVVTKDVPPYSIAAGNPARIVRSRFDPAIVSRLLRVQWWNWSDEEVNAALPFILSHNIEEFLERAEI